MFELTEDILNDYVKNAKTLALGKDYYKSNSVTDFHSYDDVVKAKVRGTRVYEVELKLITKNKIEHDCSCPVGDQGIFCKHCVAVALYHIHKKDQTNNDTSKIDIKEYLSSCKREELLDLILEQTRNDYLFLEQIKHKAAMNDLQLRQQELLQKDSVDIQSFKKTIEKEISATEYIPEDFWDQHWEYDNGDFFDNYRDKLNSILESITELMKQEKYHEVIELTEFFIQAFEDEFAAEELENFSGYVEDIPANFAKLNIDGCLKVFTDPQDIANKLLSLELDSNSGYYRYVINRYYRGSLSNEVKSCYKDLAEKRWSDNLQIEIGRYRSKGFSLGKLLEEVYKETGDYQSLAKIKSTKLIDLEAYYDLAKVLSENTQISEALKTLEDGCKKFPPTDSYKDNEVVSFYANLCSQNGTLDKALELVWGKFTRSLDLNTYRELKQHSLKSVLWLDYRKQAVELMRNELKHNNANSKNYFRINNSSTIIEMLLEDDDLLEEALKEAKAQDCRQDLWFKIADSCIKDLPDESIQIYLKHFDNVVQSSAPRYDHAVNLVNKIREAMSNTKQEFAFSNFLANTKQKYKPKRNFMSQLQEIK